MLFRSLLQKIRFDWNFHSNNIEGNTLTYGETKSLLLWGITADGKPLRDHLEIKGHNEAVEYIMEIIKGKDINITEHFIRALHSIIIPEELEIKSITSEGLPTSRSIIPGRYKTQPNNVVTQTGEMYYFTSPEETPPKMNELVNWYNEEISKNQLHPLVIASIFHYKFVRIHPFDDGNGRMARLLMNIILLKFGYPPLIIESTLRNDYLNSLQYADSGDIEKFIMFISERLTESLELWLKLAKGELVIDEF